LQLQQLSLELISYLFGSCGAARKAAGKTGIAMWQRLAGKWSAPFSFARPLTFAGQRDIAHEKLFVFSLALIRFCKWLSIVEESRVKS